MRAPCNGAESQFIEAILQYLETLPYNARLDCYDLTHAERSLIRAMCGCSPPKGFTVWLDIPALGVRANLSRKQIQRLIHGWIDSRNGQKHKGLKARGILTEVAKANRGLRRPATYRVNWDAFSLDPAQIGVLERRMQKNLPGIKRPAVPGEEIILPDAPPPPVTAPGNMRHGDACPAKTPLNNPARPSGLPGAPRQAQPGAPRMAAHQPALPLPKESLHPGPEGSPSGESLAGVVAAGASGDTVTRDMRHRDSVDASRCRSRCVTVTHRVLDLSIGSSTGISNRTSHDSRGVVELRPPTDLPPKAGSPDDASSTGVKKALLKTEAKSAFEKLVPGLQRRILREIQFIRGANLGAEDDDRTAEEMARAERHVWLVACERAGIWPHVGKQIAQERYSDALRSGEFEHEVFVRQSREEQAQIEFERLKLQQAALERETAELDQLPPKEYQALHAQAFESELVREYRGKMPPAALNKIVRQVMVKLRRKLQEN